jgi:hypothetical protein
MAFKPKETIARNETLRQIEARPNDIILWIIILSETQGGQTRGYCL